MDPALLKQREAFRKHAMAVPTYVFQRLHLIHRFTHTSVLLSRIEKKPKSETAPSFKERDDYKKKMQRPPTAPRLDSNR